MVVLMSYWGENFSFSESGLLLSFSRSCLCFRSAPFSLNTCRMQDAACSRVSSWLHVSTCVKNKMFNKM